MSGSGNFDSDIIGRRRSVAAVHAVAPVLDADELRAWPGGGLSDLDPFAFLDVVGPLDLGTEAIELAEQAYRGVHVLTFVLRGRVEHRNSLGDDVAVWAGGATQLTSGPGVVQAETLAGDADGVLHIVRLGINMPAAEKRDDPLYWPITPAAQGPVPGRRYWRDDLCPRFEYPDEGRSFRVYAGWWSTDDGGERLGPIQILQLYSAQHIVLDAGASTELSVWSHPDRANLRFTACVVAGTVETGDHRELGSGSIVQYAEDGTLIGLASSTGGEVLLLRAEPIGEPMVTDVGFVMNNEDEVVQAWNDYGAGRMGHVPQRPWIRHRPAT